MVGYFKEKRKRCSKEIHRLDILEESQNLLREERLCREALRKEFQIIVIKEEIFWRQRSKIKWLKEGD